MEKIGDAFVGAIVGGLIGFFAPLLFGLLCCLIFWDFKNPASGVFSFFSLITTPLGILMGAIKGFSDDAPPRSRY